MKREKALKERQGILSRDLCEVGDFVSMNQFMVNTKICLTKSYTREANHNMFHRVTISCDKATSIMRVENQVFLIAGKTIIAKI